MERLTTLSDAIDARSDTEPPPEGHLAASDRQRHHVVLAYHGLLPGLRGDQLMVRRGAARDSVSRRDARWRLLRSDLCEEDS